MSDPYNWFFAQDTDNVWATAGNTIYNTNKGFVGVGTTTPEYNLDITGDLQADRVYGVHYEDITNTPYQSWDINNNNIFALNTGNVGIGTVSPQTKLQVIGDITADRVFGVDYADLANLPVLSLVAFTGDYDDLLNKPALATSLWKTYTVFGMPKIENEVNSTLILRSSTGMEMITTVTSADNLNNNPRLLWTGFYKPDGILPDYYLTSRTIIDYDGLIPHSVIKDYPEWFKTLQSMGISGLVLGSVALAVATWGVAGDQISSIFKKIKDAVTGGSGEGGGGEPESYTEQNLIPWRNIGQRPFSMKQNGEAGFARDIYVLETNYTNGAAFGLYAISNSFLNLNQADNVEFSNTIISEKWLLIDFNSKMFNCKKIRCENSIQFYDESVVGFSPYSTVLELLKTKHGDWSFTNYGLFHKDNVVISYDSTQNRYIFHGIITNDEPTLASTIDTKKPAPGLVEKARRFFGKTQKGEIQFESAEPIGRQIADNESSVMKSINNARVEADELRQTVANQTKQIEKLADANAAIKREQQVKKVQTLGSRLSKALKERGNQIKAEAERIVKYPTETAGRLRTWAKVTTEKVKGAKYIKGGKVADVLGLGL